MARIIYPDNFVAEQTLFLNIHAYHLSLKTKSPLIAFLKQQKFDLAKLQAAVQPAAEQDALHISQKRDSENSTEKRDANMQLAWEHLIGEVQFLKGFYTGSERELGKWEIRVDGKSKIAYPPSFAARAQLVKDFLAKHNSYDPGESPLQVFLDEHADIVVADDLQTIEDALKNETEKNQKDDASQLATQTRDTIWRPVMEAVHKIGAFLMNLYREDSRKMGAWGFAVVAETKEVRVQVTTIKPATSKKVTSIVIPSVLYNICNIDLQIVKGKHGKGEMIVLKAGDKLGMTKGFSLITITNTSALEKGKVKVTVRK